MRDNIKCPWCGQNLEKEYVKTYINKETRSIQCFKCKNYFKVKYFFKQKVKKK